jgi:hypothetical protein
MKQGIRKLRAGGGSIPQIAAALGISYGGVCHHIYGSRGRKRPRATHNSVIRRVPVLGAQGSMSCYDVFVSLPRVSILEAAHA